jgi:hypothetical protein
VSAKIKTLSAIGFMLLTLSFIGCERSTRVWVKGGTAPVFDLSGSGSVAIFTIYSPDYMTKAEKLDDENFALWKIKPSGGYLDGTRISDLGSITYGVVPFGYAQVKPKYGTPPPLVEGQKYFYFVETTNAAGAGGYLEIKNSRAVSTTGSGPCFLDDHGKSILIPCPKGF